MVNIETGLIAITPDVVTVYRWLLVASCARHRWRAVRVALTRTVGAAVHVQRLAGDEISLDSVLDTDPFPEWPTDRAGWSDQVDP